ncbi:hypothetical protein HDU67_000623 [Dinochytrium kinnereticum]|nr:hypothetical protein HDU67_000623 [Dinochytrium kinnereticum]
MLLGSPNRAGASASASVPSTPGNTSAGTVKRRKPVDYKTAEGAGTPSTPTSPPSHQPPPPTNGRDKRYSFEERDLMDTVARNPSVKRHSWVGEGEVKEKAAVQELRSKPAQEQDPHITPSQTPRRRKPVHMDDVKQNASLLTPEPAASSPKRSTPFRAMLTPTRQPPDSPKLDPLPVNSIEIAAEARKRLHETKERQQQSIMERITAEKTEKIDEERPLGSQKIVAPSTPVVNVAVEKEVNFDDESLKVRDEWDLYSKRLAAINDEITRTTNAIKIRLGIPEEAYPQRAHEPLPKTTTVEIGADLAQSPMVVATLPPIPPPNPLASQSADIKKPDPLPPPAPKSASENPSTVKPGPPATLVENPAITKSVKGKVLEPGLTGLESAQKGGKSKPSINDRIKSPVSPPPNDALKLYPAVTPLEQRSDSGVSIASDFKDDILNIMNSFGF